MKKTLAVLLTLTLVLCMMPAGVFAELTPSGPITLTESNTTIVINAFTGVTGEPSYLYDKDKSYDLTIKRINVQGYTSQLQAGEENDYVVTYKRNGQVITNVSNVKDAGVYTVEISGRNLFTGTITKTLVIEPIDLLMTDMYVSRDITKSDIDTTGKKLKDSVIKETVTVMYGEVDITKNLTITSEIRNASTVRITAEIPTSDSGNVIGGKIYIDWPVKTELSGYEIQPISNQTYTGKPIEPNIAVKIKNGSATLRKGTDYTVSYGNNINRGSSAIVTVTGINGYTGSISSQFTILRKSMKASGISVTVSDEVYQGGSRITPKVKITDGTRTLEEGTDYTISCNSTQVGTGTVIINGKGNYQDTTTKTFNIVDGDHELSPSNTYIYVGNVTNTNTEYNVEYNGKPQTPSITVMHTTNGRTTALSSSYYNVKYTDNDKVGQATVTVTGKNGYAGSVSQTFNITAAAMNQYNTVVSGYSASYAYTGQPITPAITVSVNGYTLVSGTHYTVEYADNINISNNRSKARITVKAIEGSGYTGSVEVGFTITQKNISACTATFTDGRNTSVYTGQAIQPKVTLRDGNYRTLVEGTDYTIAYKNSAGKAVANLADTGTYTVTLTGKGNYTGTLNLTYSLTGIDISQYTVTLSEDSVQADGTNKTPVITSVTYGAASLNSSDYTVSYQDSTGKTVANNAMSTPGTYKVVVTGRNGYSGSTSADFRIVGTPQDIRIAKTSYKVYPTSASFRISATATGDGTGFSYVSNNPAVATVDANGNVTVHKVGRAVITVTTIGMKKSDPAYDEVYVKVYPLKSKLTQKPWNVSGKARTIKVRWNKQEDVTKYQVRYCRNSKFRSGTYVTKTVNNSSLPYNTQSTTLSNLRRGSRYYIKVRAVKEVYNEAGNKITYYGKWSGWKSVVVR